MSEEYVQRKRLITFEEIGSKKVQICTKKGMKYSAIEV